MFHYFYPSFVTTPFHTESRFDAPVQEKCLASWSISEEAFVSSQSSVSELRKPMKVVNSYGRELQWRKNDRERPQDDRKQWLNTIAITTESSLSPKYSKMLKSG